MHGLVNKALQSFISDAFGGVVWRDVAQHSGITQLLGADGFEAMQSYDDSLTEAVLDAAVVLLRRPRDSLLEDLGTYLIYNERMEPLRRLLRFGGVSFTDFLYSLDELQGRSHLAVPDLALPDLAISEVGADRFLLTCTGGPLGFGHVMVGILRALADDYGALVVLEHQGIRLTDRAGGAPCMVELIEIAVHDPAYHAGRRFDLATEAAQ
ncbi:heme NO-binding domain-containing protein [Pararhodobacter sp.]|uniref:heme NO-binding domain-containing protein n=1 Tax=Pararhodobacter sp. TaxID=2127056 RepID=UPI002AFED6EE|nr:heme NO-binding domain-containing protein [Pararhodobacter sp.]